MTTFTIDPDRLARVQALPLLKGAHDAPNGVAEFCILEAVAYVAGESHTDHPACCSPVIAAFLRSWNDALSDDDRSRLLKPLIPKLVGTVGGDATEQRRTWMIFDWLIRTYTPACLRLAKLTVEADALASVGEIRDAESVESAMRAINAAKANALAARSAALLAADSAADLAARSAVDLAALSAGFSAASLAARSAPFSAAASTAFSAPFSARADSAAFSAARSAALSAALSAADSALQPTTEELQASAVAMVERLCEVN